MEHEKLPLIPTVSDTFRRDKAIDTCCQCVECLHGTATAPHRLTALLRRSSLVPVSISGYADSH